MILQRKFLLWSAIWCKYNIKYYHVQDFMFNITFNVTKDYMTFLFCFIFERARENVDRIEVIYTNLVKS